MKGLEMKILLAACAAFAGSASAAELPKVWMSTQWRDPFEKTVRMCAEQGVDAIEVPLWSTNHCAQVLAALRRYKVKGFTSSGEDTSETVPPGAGKGQPFERAVFVGGAYRGKAIDRTLFSFEPKAYDIVFELPPVQTKAEKAALAKELKKYKFVVSTLPYPGARIIGKGTEGMVMKAGEIAALRKKFAAEIALCGGK